MRHIQGAVFWLAGILLASWLVYADSRSDDTGIIVGIVFLFAASFAFLQPAQPWRWGLFWGLCIPLSGFLLLALGFKHGDPVQTAQSLLALIPAFLGAYAGSWLRRLLSPLHPNDPYDPSKPTG